MITILSNGPNLVCTYADPVVQGQVGQKLEIVTDSKLWDGISKIAVFRVGDKTQSTVIDLTTGETVVPWEILEDAVGMDLEVGIYSIRPDGTTWPTPTPYCRVGRIQRGASGKDAGYPPTPDLCDQILHIAQEAKLTADEALRVAQAAGVQHVVTFSKTEGLYHADKTYEDTRAAVDAGKPVVGRYILNNLALKDIAPDYLNFATIGGGALLATFRFSSDDTVKVTTEKIKTSELDNDVGFITSAEAGGQQVFTATITNEAGHLVCDMTSREIIDADRQGVVKAVYTDEASGETRTYYYFKEMSDGRAAFSKDGYIENGTPKQTLFYVDYAGGVGYETRDPDSTSVYATCYDAADPLVAKPNTWYIPRTMPRPSADVGLMIDVKWEFGRVGGLGNDVSLVYGEPNGNTNETIVPTAYVQTGIEGEVSIPAEGTVRYQLIESNGRKVWRFVSGDIIRNNFSTDAPAEAADKNVPGMTLFYLPGMEVYVQLDKGNTAPVMSLVPDEGTALPVYGNGTGKTTGSVPAGYILHLVNAGDHWQLVNGTGLPTIGPDDEGKVLTNDGKDAKWADQVGPSDAQVGTAVDKWLSEHPGATTTVEDGSITQKKLAFTAVEGVQSPNLVPPDGMISARFTNTSGNRQIFQPGSYYNTFRMSDYIPVSQPVGSKIQIENAQGWCFYNADKSIIPDSGWYNPTIFPSGNTDMAATIPAGAKFVVLAFYFKANSLYMANYGNTLLPYESYGQISLKPNSVGADNISGVLPLSKVDTRNLLLPTIGENLVDKSKVELDVAVQRDGTYKASAPSLKKWCAKDQPIPGGGTYLCWSSEPTCAVFFDEFGSVVAFTEQGFSKVEVPEGAVKMSVNGAYTFNTPVDDVSQTDHGVFIVKAEALPEKVMPYSAKGYAEDAMLPGTLYQAVLSRMADCFDPSTKTKVGLVGDSNTIGIKGNGDTNQNPKCWANLLAAEMQRKLAGKRRIFPFGKIGVWGATNYGTTASVRAGSIVKVPFYGDSITMYPGPIKSATMAVKITVDSNPEQEMQITGDAPYTWSSLGDGYHTIQIVWMDGNHTISCFEVQKTVEVVNRGVSGTDFNHLYGLEKTGDSIDIVCYGTNERGGSDEAENVGDHEMALESFEHNNHGTRIIYMSPVPSWDTIEESGKPWQTIPYIASFVAGHEAKRNCEYIDLYNEVLNYCAVNNVELKSLYVEGLHLNDAGHRVVAEILCRKLGLGGLSV